MQHSSCIADPAFLCYCSQVTLTILIRIGQGGRKTEGRIEKRFSPLNDRVYYTIKIVEMRIGDVVRVQAGTVSEAKVSAVCKTVSLGSGQGE